MKKFRDKLASAMEYLLALTWMLASVNTFASLAVADVGLASAEALVIYAVAFATIGLGIIFSKLTKRYSLRKNMLLVSYLLTIFTFLIDVMVNGWEWSIIDSVVIGLVSAALWLRLKLRHEYMYLEEDVVEYNHEETKDSYTKH